MAPPRRRRPEGRVQALLKGRQPLLQDVAQACQVLIQPAAPQEFGRHRRHQGGRLQVDRLAQAVERRQQGRRRDDPAQPQRREEHFGEGAEVECGIAACISADGRQRSPRDAQGGIGVVLDDGDARLAGDFSEARARRAIGAGGRGIVEIGDGKGDCRARFSQASGAPGGQIQTSIRADGRRAQGDAALLHDIEDTGIGRSLDQRVLPRRHQRARGELQALLVAVGEEDLLQRAIQAAGAHPFGEPLPQRDIRHLVLQGGGAIAREHVVEAFLPALQRQGIVRRPAGGEGSMRPRAAHAPEDIQQRGMAC